MDDKNLDTLFRENLNNHEILPSPNGWSKLEQQLGDKKKPLWLIWGNYAAGFLLLLGVGIGYQSWKGTSPDMGTELVTEISPVLPNPFVPVDSVKAPESSDSPAIVQPTKRKPAPSKPAPSFNSSEQLANLPEKRLEESLPPSGQREEVWTETLAFDPIEIPLELDEVIPDIQDQENEIAYTVKIVSRGYAIAPDKGQLVDGIENKLEKIGGFFTKVDKGFGDLQDAKNDLLYQVIASKKEK